MRIIRNNNLLQTEVAEAIQRPFRSYDMPY